MKNLGKDERGLTLIELVVVMVISVILMGIAGSIILSSTGFFTKVTISDQDKLATDKIVELVDGEIMYATNVIVSNKEPNELDIKGENWHYFKFEKGRLYIGTVFYDSNKKLYRNSEAIEALSDSYYNNRNLVVKAKGYSNSYRLDLTYFFNNVDDEEEYKTKSTIAFPNLKLQYDSATTKKGWFDSVDYDSTDINFFYIYYNKTEVAVNTDDTSKYSGTVADQEVCIPKDSNEPIPFVAGNYYKYGQFVSICKDIPGNNGPNCEKDIFRYVDFTAQNNPNGKQVSEVPGKAAAEFWKRISAYYDVTASNYFEGDVVISGTNNKNKDMYYIYIGSKALKPENYAPGNIGGLSGLWAPVHPNIYKDSYHLCELINEDTDKLKSRINYTYVYNSAYTKLYDKGIFLDKDDTRIQIKNSQKENGYRPISSSDFDLSDIYIEGTDMWINISNEILNSGPKSNNSKVNWQKVQVKWDKTSAYKAGDIVIKDNSVYKALDNIPGGREFNAGYKGYWQKVIWFVDEMHEYGGFWINSN